MKVTIKKLDTDFPAYRTEKAKLDELTRQHTKVDSAITAARKRIGEQLDHDVVNDRAARLLKGEPLEQLHTDNHRALQQLQEDEQVLKEAMRQQLQRVDEARGKATYEIGKGAMKDYHDVVKRALDAADKLLAIGDELHELNAALGHEGVSSFDGGTRQFIAAPEHRVVTTWAKNVRAMWK